MDHDSTSTPSLARPVAAACHAVSQRRTRRPIAAAAGPALRQRPGRRIDPRRHLGRRHDPDNGRTRRLVTLVRGGDRRQRRYLPICLGLSGADTAKMLDTLDETAAWPIDGYLIASPYYSGRRSAGCCSISPRSPTTPHGRSCSTTFPTGPRSISRNETLLRARRTSEHRRHEGLLRRPRAIDRSAAPAARRLSRADRRGRAIFRRAHRRRRRRDPAVGAYRDRSFCLGADAAEAGQPRRGLAAGKASPN